MNRFPTRHRTRLALALALFCGVATIPARPACAWGRMGHRASARLTESRLTPAAREAVNALLEPGEALADASLWPDEHKRDLPESAPWHYVNVPITEAHYNPRYCPDSGCVVSKIPEFRLVLANRAAPPAERRKALRFLAHLVQDLHQPVHVGDRGDRGGNDLQLQYFGKGTNLHALWDYGMLERVYLKEEDMLRDLSALATPEQADCWAPGLIEKWAEESFQLAKKAYLVPGSKQLLQAGTKLDKEYEEANLAIAEERLAQAGVRLANILNEILK